MITLLIRRYSDRLVTAVRIIYASHLEVSGRDANFTDEQCHSKGRISPLLDVLRNDVRHPHDEQLFFSSAGKNLGSTG